nr:MAG TPA: Cell Wall Hydrolase [Caudoviricetes sp.]
MSDKHKVIILSLALGVFLSGIFSQQMTIYRQFDRIKELEGANANLLADVTSIREELNATRLQSSQLAEDTDIEILARIIYAEAGDQSTLGKEAVGNVVMNRVKSPKYPNSVKEVVFQPKQFKGTLHPNYTKPILAENMEIARDIYNGKEVIPDNVLFFKMNNDPTQWGLKEYRVIGDHTFYYDEKEK